MTVHQEKTVRLSLTMLWLGLAGIIGLGMLGGWLVHFWLPTAAPLTNRTEPVLTTVQEVTISPSTAAVKVVEQAQRSVLLLGEGGVGFVLTSDGLVASPTELKAPSPVATDERGQTLTLDAVGRDELYGIAYYRLRTAVLPPLDMRRDDPAVAARLLAVGRSSVTWQPQVATYEVAEYVLPKEGSAPGWHRLLQGTGTAVLPGSPLLDEEGKVAGVIIDPISGAALPVAQLNESLSRVVDNKREYDPLAEAGIVARPVFGVLITERPATFALQISSVRPQSPAAAAGLKVGDQVVSINQSVLNWNTNPTAVWRAATRPLVLLVIRNQAEQTVTIP